MSHWIIKFYYNSINYEKTMVRRDDWIYELYVKETMKEKRIHKLMPEDFYYEDGKMIMTEHYHLRRGKCCENDCRHCPYKDKK